MTHRLASLSFACVALCALAAEAREGFGFTKKAVDITRTIPPALNVAGTRVKVTASAERSSNSDDASSLRKYTEDTLVAGSRFAAAEAPDVHVVLSVNRLDSDDQWESKTEYESKPFTREVYNSSKKKYETKTEYRSVPVTKQYKIVSGTVDGKYTIADRRGNTIESGPIETKFYHRYADGTGAVSPREAEDDMLRRAAVSVAARLVPTSERVSVLLPKGSFEAFIPIAESGAWDRYLAAVEAVPEKRDRGSEAYRQYALGVAKEAVAYMTSDQQRATDLLRESVQHYENAASFNPDETLFRERYESLWSGKLEASMPRAKESLARYEAWRTAPVAVAKATSSSSAASKSASSAKIMRNETVLEMSAAGLTDENIILAINAARERRFDVSPEALIALSKAGVSKSVIAHMQKRAQ